MSLAQDVALTEAMESPTVNDRSEHRQMSEDGERNQPESSQRTSEGDMEMNNAGTADQNRPRRYDHNPRRDPVTASEFPERRETRRSVESGHDSIDFVPSVSIGINQYAHMVSRLSECMPHLKQVQEEDCRCPTAGQIVCYDTTAVSQHQIQFRKYLGPEVMKDSGLLMQEVRQLAQIPSGVQTRYLIVEDLSPTIVEALGSVFWMNPEFFEEHLEGSGWLALTPGEQNPKTWITSTIPKDFVSLRWLRSVNRYCIPPMTQIDREAMLKDGEIKKREMIGQETIYKVTTNIFRQEWPLIPGWENIPTSGGEKATIPSAWEERLTMFHRSLDDGRQIVIILMDALPHIEKEYRVPRSHSRSKGPSRPIYQKAYARIPVDEDFSSASVFKGNILSEQQFSWLHRQLTETSSTASEFNSWLHSQTKQSQQEPKDVLFGLLWMVNCDILGFLRSATNLLEDVRHSSEDEDTLQRQLNHWRSVLSRLQLELQEIRRSVQSFTCFIEKRGLIRNNNIFLHMNETLMQVDELFKESQKSYEGLRADIALLENKRGISQAESVGKLTELGFLFLPVSCVAALFSMQVKELEDGVPLNSFIIAAVVTLSIAYLGRLLVRSAMIHGWIKEISSKIRTHSKLSNSHPLSTRAVISWIFSSDFVSLVGAVVRRVVTYFLPLILFALVILPILFVWNHKGLDSGYKAVLTLLVFGGAITVAVIPGAYWDWWARSTRIRRTIFEVRLFAERLREHSVPADSERGSEISDPIL